MFQVRTLYVFDNDGTLYDDTEAQKQFMMIFQEYASELFGVPYEEVIPRLQTLKAKYSTEFSLIAPMKEIGMNYADIVGNTYLRVKLDECKIISPDTIRSQVLSEIHHPKIVFTNNPSVFARKVLSYTGLAEYFSDFVGMEETDFSGKPSSYSFEVVERRHHGYDQIVFVDDSLKNLDAALQHGWKTVWCKPISAPETKHKHLVIDSFEDIKGIL